MDKRENKRGTGKENGIEKHGYLKVKVSSAEGAFPTENAVVLIRDEKEESGGVIYSLRTDVSGITETVMLPAKDRELSQSPDNEKPYFTYSVTVSKPGFIPVNISGVSVFEGIEATLPVDLVPEEIYFSDQTEKR